tara:strand:+ start:202 stop:897 length:696 start_codon:yes stop_codon:yes gene_type:complete
LKYLISGTKSGLGKFLFQNLKKESLGLNRNNRNLLKKFNSFDVIIHCAFNKENEISDYYKYIDDNIFLTEQLLKLNYKKFIYISSIDVYSQKNSNYVLFKKISEKLVMKKKNTLILRCSSMVGESMKNNHLLKIKKSKDTNLSSYSTFNYILMSDIFKFILNHKKIHNRVIDFVSNKNITLKSVSNFFNSNTVFGKSRHITKNNFINPIFKYYDSFSYSSLQNLNRYFKKY